MSTWWFSATRSSKPPAPRPSAIGRSCASSTKSGSTRKVSEVSTPSAPRPTRAAVEHVGVLVRVARSTVAVAGDQLQPGHLRGQRGGDAAGAVGAGGDGAGQGLLGDVAHVVQAEARRARAGR